MTLTFGTWCEDAWLTTAALIGQTSRLKFLVAFRPGLISPTLAAQMAATYQRLSRGRLLLNVVTGGQSVEQRRFGDHVSHDERYARTGEFLAIVRGAWTGAPFDFDGTYYQVTGATVMQAPEPVPGVFFGGSSAAAGPVAARYVDTYLTWGGPPEQVAEKLDWIRGLAAAEGRKLRFGIRLHVITRDTEAEAWAVANTLLDHIDPAEVAGAQKILGASESTGQARMRALHATYRHGGRASDLEIYPHLWAGVGLSAAARAPPWWAATSRWPTSSRSTPRWASASSSCPDTRTWRRLTGSPRACCPSCASGECGHPRAPRRTRTGPGHSRVLRVKHD